MALDRRSSHNLFISSIMSFYFCHIFPVINKNIMLYSFWYRAMTTKNSWMIPYNVMCTVQITVSYSYLLFCVSSHFSHYPLCFDLNINASPLSPDPSVVVTLYWYPSYFENSTWMSKFLFASLSTLLLPRMPMWARTQMNVTSMPCFITLERIAVIWIVSPDDYRTPPT